MGRETLVLPRQKERTVAKVVLFQDVPNQSRHYLVLNKNQRDKRDLPGGGIDPGETAEQGVIREVHEEIGPYAAHSVSELRLVHKDKSKRLLMFLGRLPLGTPILPGNEHTEEYYWVRGKELKNMFDETKWETGVDVAVRKAKRMDELRELVELSA